MSRTWWFASFVLSLSFSNRTEGNEGWDESFGVPGAVGGGVSGVTMLRNKLIVGGNFRSIGGVSATNIAQWDGTNWAELDGGIQGGTVYALTVVGDDLFVGGSFLQAGELRASNVARWDGTNWAALGGGVNGAVIALASDGAYLYAGGSFTSADGLQVGKVARWDGTNWSSLGLGITPVAGFGAVDSLVVARGGLYAAGRFRVAGGNAATNIARWDGTNWSALGSGLRILDGYSAENGSVNALTIANGALYAGGVFQLAGTTRATNIAAWDGSQWLSIGGGVHGLGSIRSLTVSGRDLIVGGGFTNIGGVPANRVAIWSGESWSRLGTGISEFGEQSGSVLGLASTGSELVAVGVFDSAGGNPSTNIALWHIPHSLAIRRSTTEVRLSWAETGSNFVLEGTSALGGGQEGWQAVSQTPVLEKPIFQVGEWVVTNGLAATNQFYRLKRR